MPKLEGKDRYRITYHDVSKSFLPPSLSRPNSCSLATLLVPQDDKKTERLYIETARTLLDMPGFKRDIQFLQATKDDGRYRDDDLGRICETWHIPKAESWLEWLADHWTSGTRPNLLNCPSRPESLLSWRICLIEQGPDETGPWTGRQAIIIVNAGISEKEAQRAATCAVQLLKSQSIIRGRPGLTEFDRQLLLYVFEELGIPKPRRRSQMVTKVHEKMTKEGRAMSHATISNELRRWLNKKGQPVKRYVTD